MYNKILITVIAILLLFIVFIIYKPAQYEYKIISDKDSDIGLTMNGFGADGWEVISARRATSSDNSGAVYELIIKRKKPIF